MRAEHVCETGKFCFSDEGRAWKVAEQMANEGKGGEGLLNVYFHAPCGFFHIGRLYPGCGRTVRLRANA